MKTVGSYSIKGGVGKTAFAVNFAYESARLGKRTLLIDLDPQGAAGFYFRVRARGKLKPRKLLGDAGRLRAAIRESDYPKLDTLPSKLSFRKFDIALKRKKKSRSRLGRLLEEFRDEYDVLVVDSPPNITLLSENLFRAADVLVVPVVPTTLSQRTLDQLYGFFTREGLPLQRIVPFLSMVEKRKTLHRATCTQLRERYDGFLETSIPYCTEVERMGVRCAPLLDTDPKGRGGKAYRRLCGEVLARLDRL